MDLYGPFFRSVLFPVWERGIRRRPILTRLAELERTQWLPLDQLRELQLRELRKLLAHAHAHVPFYRARLDAAGVAPQAVSALDDLSRVPILGRDEAQEAGDARTSTAPPLPAITKSTSGTMGRPLKFGYDLGSEHWRQAVKLRGYGWSGYRIGDRTLHYWGAVVAPMARRRKAFIATDRFFKREIYMDSQRRGDADLDAVVATIRAERPRAIVAYAQAVADLARHVNAHRLRTWGDIPVLLGAEPVYAADREALTEAFGPGIFETYGGREVMLMAAECPAHSGLHVQMENLLLEIVVRGADGRARAAAPGEVGEIVVTDLHNYGMPFIRYANGDLGAWAEPGPCACGRGLERLARIEGRTTDMMTDAQGRRVSGITFLVMFSAIGDVARQYQVVQHPDRSITVRLVPTPRLDDRAREHIRRTCAKYFDGLPVAIDLVDDIPLSPSGKRRPIIVQKD